MERKVVYSSETKAFLRGLVYLLFEKEYFGFEEDAKNYVDKITYFIEEKLPDYPTKPTPEKLEKFGEKYIVYKANDRTSWYIFFSQEEEFYFIKFITNNHTDFIKDFNL